MSELTKGQLRSDNNSSFPNNNTQAITPTILRDFNGNIIDSLVDEIGYNIDSGSWNQKIAAAGISGSLLTTASFSEATRNMTFTKADGTTFTTNIADGAAVATGSFLETASLANNGLFDMTFTKADGSTFVVNIPLAAATGSLLKDASNNDNATTTYERGNGATFTTTINNVNNAVSSSVANSVPFSGVTNKPPFLVSGSSQVSYPELSNIPAGILSGSIAGNLPSGVVSGSSQLTSSYDARYELSGSATSLPSGVISGSSQVDYPQIANIPSGIVSSSVVTSIVAGTDITITPVGGTGAVTVNSTATVSLPAGTISGSSQVDYPLISNIPSGIVSGSSQVSFPGLSNIPAGIISSSQQLPGGLVSGSSQLTSSYDTRYELSGSAVALPSGTVSGSSQIDYPNISNIPAGIISGSSQVVLPAGTVSGSSQVDYPNISNIPGGIISGSSQLPGGLVSGSTFPFTGNAQITGSLIVSQSGLSSGDDVFILGFPRTGGNSLEGAIRSTVDDGLHLYGNKQFGNGGCTFSGGIMSFESGPVQLGPAGAPVNLEMKNGSAIVVDPQSAALPITGNMDVSGSLEIFGISDVSASIAAAAASGGGGGSVPAGTVSGSSQVSYPLLSNIPAGIVSGSSQIDITATTNYGNVATLAGNNTFTGDNEFGTSGTTQNFNGTNNIPTIAGDIIVSDGGNGSTIEIRGTAGRKVLASTTSVTATRSGTKSAYLSGEFDSYVSVYDSANDQEFGFGLNGLTGLGTGWDGPSIVNNATSGFPYDSVIGFEKMGAYVDNRVAYLSPSHYYEKVIINKSVETAVSTVTPAGDNSVTIDFASSSLQTVTLGSGVTNAFRADNVSAGQTIKLRIQQNGSSASTVSFTSDFKQPDGATYTATTTLGAVDILTLTTFTSTSEIFLEHVNKFV